MRRRPVTALFLVVAMFATACASAADVPALRPTTVDTTSSDTDERPPVFRYPPAPDAPAADVADAPEVRDAMDRLDTQLRVGEIDDDALADVVEYGDARHAWYVADLIRFFGPGENGTELVDAFESLTGTSIADDPDSERSVWLSTTNHLIAWDTPDYPDYRLDKADLFLLVEERWEPFFGDEDADIDWRHLSWGGVLIDDRELGDTDGCARGCIPALDDPAVTDADGGDWYPDDAIVFGIVEGDEALAIPKNIAEIHEMFNLTLGERRFGIPYCTLCGSAQAYRTDDAVTVGGADEVPVLRTSGLLSRSNKVMYDLRTQSVFDTFTGAAVSGPLQDRGDRPRGDHRGAHHVGRVEGGASRHDDHRRGRRDRADVLARPAPGSRRQRPDLPDRSRRRPTRRAGTRRRRDHRRRHTGRLPGRRRPSGTRSR